MTDKCDHKDCDLKACVSIFNAGTRLTPLPMYFCKKHAEEFLANTMFPENYLVVAEN